MATVSVFAGVLSPDCASAVVDCDAPFGVVAFRRLTHTVAIHNPMLARSIATIPIVLFRSRWCSALIDSRRNFKSVAANAVEGDGADFSTGRFELPTARGMAWDFRKVIAGRRSLGGSGRPAVNRVE